VVEHELADFAPDTGHLHRCEWGGVSDQCPNDCAAVLYALAQDTDREARFTAHVLARVGAYPLHGEHTPQGIRAWAQAHVAAGTDLDPATLETP
jgi:hypothetical protein